MTNRHVAFEFPERDRRDSRPKSNSIGVIRSISTSSRSFATQRRLNSKLTIFLFIANDTGPHLAFLKLQPSQISKVAQTD